MVISQTIRRVEQPLDFSLPVTFDFTITDHLISLSGILFRMPAILMLNNGKERVFRYTRLEANSEAVLDQLPAGEYLPLGPRRKDFPPNCSVMLMKGVRYHFILWADLASEAGKLGTLFLVDQRTRRFSGDKKALLARMSDIYVQTILNNSVSAEIFDPLKALAADIPWFSTR